MKRTLIRSIDRYLTYPDDIVHFNELTDDLQRATFSDYLGSQPNLIKHLSLKQEAVLILFMYGLSRWEIGQLFRMSSQDLFTMLFRIRQRLYKISGVGYDTKSKKQVRAVFKVQGFEDQ